VSLALVFPGQASQAVGMGVELRAASEAARRVFGLADAVTGLPISQTCAEGPLERLTETDMAQPAVVATSLAALAYLKEQHSDLVKPAAVAGHSVGEISACVAAGILSEEDALRLIHVRATAMADACHAVDGSMVVILGLEDGGVEEACRLSAADGEVVEVANYNAPGQVVISGHRAAVERAAMAALAAGARRALPLNVGGPFHSACMESALAPLRLALGATAFHDATIPLVGNVTARALSSGAEVVADLSEQVARPVRWTESLQTLRDLGCDTYLELGQGQVLAGLIKRALPDARAASFGAPGDLPAVERLLGSSAR
jgi:[acyl-carrier-protein] S-malonyltransferase